MPPVLHALLGASSANRWIHCTPSARLCENMPDETSVYAETGTLAHAVAELKARRQLCDLRASEFNSKMKTLKQDKLFAAEIDTATDEYVDALQQFYLQFEDKPYITLEQRVDYSEYVPDGFGTADCIMIGNGVMHVVDYKNGSGVVVDAEDNPQMKLYALGAAYQYSFIYDIKRVLMSIVQPHAGGVHTSEISADDLFEWANSVVKPAAAAAWKGEGEEIPGDWCKFCKIKATCRARGNYLALEAFGKKEPPTYTDNEIGGILSRARGLEAWVADMQEYATKQLLAGKQIPGWKMVAGRAVRQFDDTDAALQAIVDSGVDRDLLYVRKPLTLAQTEKLVGKKQFADIAGSHVITPPGKPTLVPETDKRPPYNLAAEAFKN